MLSSKNILGGKWILFVKEKGIFFLVENRHCRRKNLIFGGE